MGKRALLLVNRQASHGEENRDEAIKALKSAGLELYEEPGDAAHLEQVIRQYRDRVDLVIVGGGDGTLHAALPALVETQLPLGIVPLGTANDLAHTLGIPGDLAGACRVIAEGHSKRIDLGWVNGKLFLNVASIGLTVAITRQLSKETKSRWGVLAYLLTAARVVLRARPFRAEIRAGGQTFHVRTVQITVGNGRYYGGGMAVAEDAAIDDKRLDLYSLEIDHWWQIVPLLPALWKGSLERWTRARTLHGHEFEVHVRRPRAVTADGEITTHTPARFRLLPHALSVFVPRNEASNGASGPKQETL